MVLQPLKLWRLTITVTDPETGTSTSIEGLVDDLDVNLANDGEFDDFGLGSLPVSSWSDGERTVDLSARWRLEGDEFYRITNHPATEPAPAICGDRVEGIRLRPNRTAPVYVCDLPAGHLGMRGLITGDWHQQSGAMMWRHELRDAHLRDGRYCSVHGIDLVPPDRTLATRKYCPKCPEGSALGWPMGTGHDHDPRCDRDLCHPDCPTREAT
jgi:hypothetical protein